MDDWLCVDWDEDDWLTDCVNGGGNGGGSPGEDENRMGGEAAIRRSPS